ncbi:MAG: hypothetical protein ABI986_10470, partial [Chloroflexota bacterium]
NGAEIQKLVAPILLGSSEVVIGDRQTARSPHMSSGKRFLQRWGSWAVSRASGVAVPDATSGFRAFSREAAYQINVFNPFTYTLETIIQAGNRNLGIQSVPVATNAPTRPSRHSSGTGTSPKTAFMASPSRNSPAASRFLSRTMMPLVSSRPSSWRMPAISSALVFAQAVCPSNAPI